MLAVVGRQQEHPREPALGRGSVHDGRAMVSRERRVGADPVHEVHVARRLLVVVFSQPLDPLPVASRAQMALVEALGREVDPRLQRAVDHDSNRPGLGHFAAKPREQLVADWIHERLAAPVAVQDEAVAAGPRQDRVAAGRRAERIAEQQPPALARSAPARPPVHSDPCGRLGDDLAALEEGHAGASLPARPLLERVRADALQRVVEVPRIDRDRHEFSLRVRAGQLAGHRRAGEDRAGSARRTQLQDPDFRRRALVEHLGPRVQLHGAGLHQGFGQLLSLELPQPDPVERAAARAVRPCEPHGPDRGQQGQEQQHLHRRRSRAHPVTPRARPAG